MERISIKKDEREEVVAVTITEDELIEAFQKASKKLADELEAKGIDPVQNMMAQLREICLCHNLRDILFEDGEEDAEN